MNAETTRLMFSSKRPDWGTPQDLYDRLDAEFKFELDAAASETNHKAPRWYSDDGSGGGLARSWAARTFCNPPYGRGMGAWVKKASEEVASGRCPLAVLLLPARTDTAWFHDYCLDKPGVEIRFLRGRVRFVLPDGARNAAPFPSILVIFRRVP